LTKVHAQLIKKRRGKKETKGVGREKKDPEHPKKGFLEKRKSRGGGRSGQKKATQKSYRNKRDLIRDRRTVKRKGKRDRGKEKACERGGHQ